MVLANFGRFALLLRLGLSVCSQVFFLDVFCIPMALVHVLLEFSRRLVLLLDTSMSLKHIQAFGVSMMLFYSGLQ